MYGLAVPLYAPQFVRFANGGLERIRTASAGDYLQPAVFILPSIALLTRRYTQRTLKQDDATLKRHWITQANKSDTPPGFKPINDDDYDYSASGMTLAVIVPAGLTAGPTDSKNLSVGVGLSLGWPVAKGAEVGFCFATIWTQAPYLSDQQKGAVGKTLPMGVSDQIDTRLRPLMAFGLYVSPTF